MFCTRRAAVREFRSYSTGNIKVSEELSLNGSRFVGRAARLGPKSASPEDECREILSSLLKIKKIANASHPAMYAWKSGQQIGRSDSGEAGAGVVLSELLQNMGVDNTIVIVTRWYGGSPIGPARFRLIKNVAQDALRKLLSDEQNSPPLPSRPKPTVRKKHR